MDGTVFPSRDFISIAGFAKNADVLVQARRSGVIGDAIGRTDASGFIEVNHPGGVCWTGQTPNIVAGDFIDVFKVENNAFSSGQVQSVINTKVIKPAFLTANGEVRVNGIASEIGVVLALGLVEQRIINPDLAATRIGRRDVRADTSGGRVDNVAGGAGSLLRTGVGPSNEWRAIYTGLSDAEQQLAVAGQSRAIAWLSTNASGDRFGLTISEFGEVGGPAMGGCPATGNIGIAIP